MSIKITLSSILCIKNHCLENLYHYLLTTSKYINQCEENHTEELITAL